MAECQTHPGSLASITLLLWLSLASWTAAAEVKAESLEYPPENAPRTFYVEEIKAATRDYVERRSDADGVFLIHDPVTDKTLSLRFVKIHDPVRVIDDDTYFACTDFEVIDSPEQLYDLDFWLRPAQQQLEVIDEKIHKEPRHALIYGWYKHPRYTFVDDEVVPLYEK